MKSLLLLTVALVGTTSVALAQTVLPSGAVAPTGTITPGTVPGSQPVTTPDMRNGGSPRAHRHDEIAPGMTHSDKKRLRKMAKVKPSRGSTKTSN